jgi:hypothetical protein
MGCLQLLLLFHIESVSPLKKITNKSSGEKN